MDRCEVIRKGRRCRNASHLLFKGKGVCEECWDRLNHEHAPPGALYLALGMKKEYRQYIEQLNRTREQEGLKPKTVHRVNRRKPMARVKKSKKISKKKVTKRTSTGSGKGRAGKTSGLRVAEFWEKLMANNFKARLTDEKLASEMNKEFPSDTPYDIADVKAHRSLFNRGKLRFQKSKPKNSLHEWDSKGNAIPLWGTRGKTKKSKKQTAKDDVKFAAKRAVVKRRKRK